MFGRLRARLTLRGRFGPFVSFFVPSQRRLPYLELLGLVSPGADRLVRRTHRAAARDKDGKYTERLLAESDWRPHIVGGLSVYHRPSERGLRQLWSAIDQGSWVTPQLVAVASLVDPMFVKHATRRLENLCPIELHEDVAALDPLEAHHALGPDGLPSRSAKMAVALLALVEADHGPQPKLRSSTDLAALLLDDMDTSDEIARQWRTRLQTMRE